MSEQRTDPFTPRPREATASQAASSPSAPAPIITSAPGSVAVPSPITVADVPYEYHIVPFIGQIRSNPLSKDTIETVSAQLSAIIVGVSRQGWEFYRIDQVQVFTNPGCLGALFGRKAELFQHDQVIFRRPTRR